MYTKNIKIHRGVTNTILFEFLNQDQKPVNITGSTFTIRFIDSTGKHIMLSKNLTVLHAGTGRTKLVLTDTEVDSFVGNMVSYGIEKTTGSTVEPVFVDAYADGRGTAVIVDSSTPAFVVSKTLNLADQDIGIQYSDIVMPDSISTTFQYWNTGFVGTVVLQGSTALTGPWYTISTDTYTVANTDTHHMVATGSHVYLRLAITTTSGTFDKIIYR